MLTGILLMEELVVHLGCRVVQLLNHSNRKRTLKRLSGLGYSRARATAAVMPPAAATWLSLIISMSYSPMRWFSPPPINTAHLSSTRSLWAFVDRSQPKPTR